MSCILNATLCTDDLVLQLHNTSQGAVFGGIQNCSQSCNGYDMIPLQHSILKYTILVFSLLCLVISTIIVILYIFNYRKVHHPEAPLYYISICYLGISISYFLSTSLPTNIIRCEDDITPFNTSVALHDSFKLPLCVIVFAVLYYFTVASWVWGLLITIEWFVYSVNIATPRKKFSERTFIILHFIGWGSPIPMLIGAIVSQSVSGSYPLQTCWITEQHNGIYQMLFIIVPSLLIIIASSVILIIGFIWSIYRSKYAAVKSITNNQNQLSLMKTSQNKLVSQLSRTSSFTVLFLIILSISMGSNFYEYTYQTKWEITYLQTRLHQKDHLCYPHSETHTGYIISLYIIRFITSEIVGILLVLWFIKKELICFCSNESDPRPQQQQIIQRPTISNTVANDINVSINSNTEANDITVTSDTIPSIT